MDHRRAARLVLSAVLLGLTPLAGAVVPITYENAPSAPFQLAVGRDGAIYFLEYATNKLAYRKSNGTIVEVPIPTASSSPGDLAVAPDGSVWFTELDTSRIARYDRFNLDTPITEFVLSNGALPNGIAVGVDGNLWFTEFGINKIGRITSGIGNAIGSLDHFDIPTSGSQPDSIALGDDGTLWFTESAKGRVGSVDVTGVVTDYAIPAGASSDPRGITLGPDGAIWFCERGANKIARMVRNGPGVTITEFPLPNPGAPSKIAAGPGRRALVHRDGEQRADRADHDERRHHRVPDRDELRAVRNRGRARRRRLVRAGLPREARPRLRRGRREPRRTHERGGRRLHAQHTLRRRSRSEVGLLRPGRAPRRRGD
jgi:virginiamycin B lyase